MGIEPFTIARLPRIVFGAGRIREVPALAASYGRRALLVTGKAALQQSVHWPALLATFKDNGVSWEALAVEDEPSPELIDRAVQTWRTAGIEVVVGIGGGSVLDAAKAVAGLLPRGNSVMDHLEGVGRDLPYTGPATPFVAVPTTAGTGSEATRNAVLSVRGENGFKKSFRHELLVAQYAVVDPELLATCPRPLLAANGMDALTQLIESYVSAKANPVTDALALSGINAFKDGFFAAWQGEDTEAAAGRAAIAYAALLSGITLAQAGLGSVHGLAAPLGAFFPIPHGVACGTLLAAATRINLRALRERAPTHPALAKYAQLGELLSGRRYSYRESAWQALLEALHEWTELLAVPRLTRYGVTAAHVDKLVANARGSSMATNPVVLSDAEIAEIVSARL